MVVAFDILFLIPVFILAGILLLFGAIVLLGRWKGGKYLKPILIQLQKVPFMNRWLQKASRAALEKQNPELASAMRKLEPHAKGPSNRAERRRLERARKRSR